MSGLLGNWLVPVNPRAKNPRVFKVPLRGMWDAPSRHIIGNLGRIHKRWSPRIKYGWETLSRRTVLPHARRILSQRYGTHTGKAARSLRVLGSYSSGPKARVELGSTLFANDPPVYGDWSFSPFAYPLGLHEGIKRHKVFIRYKGKERKGLKQWALSHGFNDPGRGRNWAIFVYRRGRPASRSLFLHKAVMARRPDFEETIFRALYWAVGGQYGRSLPSLGSFGGFRLAG